MVNRGYVEPKSDKPHHSKRNPLQRDKPTLGPNALLRVFSRHISHVSVVMPPVPKWQDQLENDFGADNFGDFPDTFCQILNNIIVFWMAQCYKSNSYKYISNILYNFRECVTMLHF